MISVLKWSQARVNRQPLAQEPTPGLAPLGEPQPYHWSLLNNVLRKEVSVTVIGHFEVILLLWGMWEMRGPQQFAPAGQIACPAWH